jgi:two-component sensor histidine kinase
MDIAVPLGIIINELVSNSLKHAFIKDNAGEIYIKLQSSKEHHAKGAAKDEKDKLILTVKDNGVGFPEKLDFRETTSLGLQLVTALVDQIEGNIELDTTAGTEFKISFLRG